MDQESNIDTSGALYPKIASHPKTLPAPSWMGLLLCALWGSALFTGCQSATRGGSRLEISQQGLQTSSCILPNGHQDHSLQYHWNEGDLPLKLSFHTASQWQGAELEAALSAVDQWNGFFTWSKGTGVLDYGSRGQPRASTRDETSPSCEDGTPSDGTVLYKRGDWVKGEGVIALTSFCIRRVGCDATGNAISCLPVAYRAIIELNYKNFFVSASRRFPDLQSIVLHELGHLLGLDHSCDTLNSSTGDLPNIACPNSGSSDDLGLRLSVMNPYWSTPANAAGEQRRILQPNDQGRANCLYGYTPPSTN